LPKETVTIVDEDDDTVMEDQGLQSARLFSWRKSCRVASRVRMESIRCTRVTGDQTNVTGITVYEKKRGASVVNE
jgi:hypothetical protein